MSSDDENGLAKDPSEYEPSPEPSIEVGEPDVSDTAFEPPTPGEDIDVETYGLFWRLVLVFDVALLALALGPMFVYFEGDWQVGLPLFALGVLSFGYGVVRYRRFRADQE